MCVNVCMQICMHYIVQIYKTRLVCVFDLSMLEDHEIYSSLSHDEKYWLKLLSRKVVFLWKHTQYSSTFHKSFHLIWASKLKDKLMSLGYDDCGISQSVKDKTNQSYKNRNK